MSAVALGVGLGSLAHRGWHYWSMSTILTAALTQLNCYLC